MALAATLLNLVSLSLCVIGSLLYIQLGLAAVPVEEDHGRRRLVVNILDFISIDCGALEDSLDDSDGIPYKSDKSLIDSGESHQISSEYYGNIRLQYRNLRSFPERVKNCYTLKPQAGKNNNYLIRAIFGFGNYDGKNSFPIFDIYLGVNLWQTVMSDHLRTEVIHMATTDYIDACLVNIGSGLPYISALELRRLDSSIYQIENDKLLSYKDRFDVGSTVNVRYPQDVYDRVWEPMPIPIAPPVEMIWTTESITESNIDHYKLPESMLKTAYKTQNSTLPLIYTWIPDAVSSRFYFCFHFAEIEKLAPGKFREMSIVLNDDDGHAIEKSVKLEYLKRRTICSAGLPVNVKEKNSVKIYASPDSDVPPILNGLEVFTFKDLSYSPTFLEDVNAIMDIKQTYKLRRNWQGDPCLPTAYRWEGLNCSGSNPPRIISLNLSWSNLTGDIPFYLSSLTVLESLDLSYNNLTGSLPEFLAQLPRLKILNLVGNNLQGTVPEALLYKSRHGDLDLRVDELLEHCLSPPCKKRKDFLVPVLIAVIAALVLLILVGLLIIYTRKRNLNSIKAKAKGPLTQKNREYNYSEIVRITENFKTTIGEGGFGKVYLGELKDKTLVAVKLLSPSSKQGYKEFQAEAQLLMIVHHQNLVSLIGYCDEGDTKALIYEYMANGDLRQHLNETKTNTLTWNDRLKIAVDTAHGLEYLYNGCKPPIIHRDLKPANILLDDGMQAKIADFGLSKTFTSGNEFQILTRIVGTPGYLDPEIQISGNLNKKSEIYSFGIILFELITGSPAITRSSGGNVHILDWVTPIINRGDIQNIVDMGLKGEFNRNSAWKMVEIAMSCTQPIANQRPNMSHILEELKECLEVGQRTSTECYNMPSRILFESEIAPSLR